MTDDELVTRLLAELSARVDGWSWAPTGSYTPSQVGLYYGSLPTAPDRGVGAVLYSADDELPTRLKVRRVQLRFRGARGDRAGADKLAGQAFAELHGLTRAPGLALVSRVLVAQLGTDQNARQERADSYQIILENLEAS